ncbi:hypothetical protein CBR_g46020 [Chara braunii]|uniref:Uncharacterized protein n=1 Tax=Chara braunii TaxID=69332 RepID=A0A388LZW5_CHABU|nr:hypothetical protein CBR_g46020 [Chara braunii]|eukprot:GBG87864.1 hypothetical protein CBR_g46020 [Chara braunii]
MRLHRQTRKERDEATTETLGVKRIIAEVLAKMGYGKDSVVQRKVVTTVQGRGHELVVEKVVQGEWDEEETVPQHLVKARHKQRNLAQDGQSSRKGQAPEALTVAPRTRTRAQNKAIASQEPPRKEPEQERWKKVVEIEEDDNEDEEDERLRQKEDQRAEQRAKKRGVQEKAEPILRDVAPKKKKHAVPLEEGFDVERMVDRLLEGHNDLMNLKDILTSAPKFRDGLKGRLLRRLVPNVRSTILPKEAEWAETGTRMN